ncbi:MAG: ferrochelatase [Armatimonadota bacterium]|nr:ferrochelatase [Armatimonadota bacterium]MDR7458411.1 ferrochelatase [Armatimonadota bacterium]MDR7478787.1 ferrochelatase [Armatimonadota bacterium]MDR7488245.1 ferrochelatase [Armatimonadota bacterium]MDR7490604.1 ferrochelatase [Armatimonadota bacterium]
MKSAVLLMAYGSPRSLDDVEAYYTHIRGGRRPSPELLADLVERYRAIGGRSPLPEITARQAAALEEELRRRGHPVPVRVGMKHSAPFIGEAVQALAAEEVTHLVGLVLAPHYSRMSIGQYVAAAEAARPAGVTAVYVEQWHDHPGYLRVVAERVRAGLAGLPEPATVVFTAHSLPERILAWDDPYPRQVEESARLAAALAGVERWTVAYQSAGRTAEPWLGPDLRSTLADLRRRDVRGVLVAPIGFVADHLEVLYDVDLEAQSEAERLGMRLARTAMPNDAPDFIAVLADLVTPRPEDPRP